LRDAVAAAICGDAFDRLETGAGGKIDDGQAAARFEGANEVGVELGGLGEVVLDAA